MQFFQWLSHCGISEHTWQTHVGIYNLLPLFFILGTFFNQTFTITHSIQAREKKLINRQALILFFLDHKMG